MSNYEEQNPINTILLLLEDDIAQRSILEATAERFFVDSSTVEICVSESTTEVIKKLEQYSQDIPKASVYAVLDYNMGLNQPGERKTTESLFFENTFNEYLKNGGIIVIYSGYPEQVRQSSIIMNANRKYKNLLLLIAEKSSVQMDSVFRILKGVRKDMIPRLKTVAKKCQFDMGKVLELLRKGKKA